MHIPPAAEKATSMTSTTIPSGHVGNLTPEQEEKLKKMWAALYRIFGVTSSGDDTSATTNGTSALLGPSSDTAKDGEKEKLKKKSLFSRKPKEPTDAATAQADADDKYGQTKLFQEALQKETPDALRNTLWSMIKHDDPDSLMLRFLRARKWDVEKALIMLISAVSWRSSEMKLDTDIMVNGDAGALRDSISGTGDAKIDGIGLMDQIRMGKAFFHGCDKESRPLCFVRVRLHHQGEQSEASQERNTVLLIETARLMLQPPVETATIVFDMTGFSISNMDYAPVKFMIKCFEANYPECLGVVLVYKAPWVFQGFWKIIRGWLDPVVANKIRFVNSVKDLSEYIPEDRIPHELDGTENWSYKYVEPVDGENDLMKDTTTRDKIQAERDQYYKDFEQSTIRWIKGDSDTTSQRNEVKSKLRQNYWTLDPYIRARSLYDRIGVLNPGGKITYYPTNSNASSPATAISETPATGPK
ncbi:Phosphatidylinositol transfer protein CSR1 [Ceratocystis lukuohia]|uniref:Phosphatidylinositol transfer protein CSR1 n=1 Tax=Ceratocystis lukuohia TaxID=2019550 RepID=A0ABR4MQC4_9PEZI